MPLNVLGGQKIYTVQEIDTIVRHSGAGFEICDKLPSLATAIPNCVYYKKSDKKVTDTWWSNPNDSTDTADEQDATHTEQHSEEHQTLVPYIKGTKNGEACWYTADNDHEAIPKERIREIWQQEIGTPKQYKIIPAEKALVEVG